MKDQKQTDQDRTRTELVQRYCVKCLGVTPHTLPHFCASNMIEMVC